MATSSNMLSIELVLNAYCQGYFPMPDPQSGRMLWFNPDPRAVLPLDGFHCSHSLRRLLQKNTFTHSINKDFTGVMAGCAERPDTWINDEIKDIYAKLYRYGFAHSLEVWKDGQLAGGLYGVAINGAFFAESKFHRVSNASKLALFYLVQHLRARGFALLEVQFLTDHLQSLGVVEVPRTHYLQLLNDALEIKAKFL